MKTSHNLLAILILLGGLALPTYAKTLKVGIVFDGPSDSSLVFIQSITEELNNIVPQGDEVIFPEKDKIVSKFDTSKIRLGLDKLMKSKDVDAVLAIGPVASHIAASLNKYNKPVVATHIYNAILQNLKNKNGVSNCKNLSYIDMNIDIGKHIEKFQEIKTFKKLHLLISPHMLNGIPQLADKLRQQMTKTNVELKILSSNTPISDLPKELFDAEAVYVAPLPDLSENNKNQLISKINELKLPTMAMFGKDMLDNGILCTIATGIDTQKLARRIANNLSRILYGEDPSSFPTTFSHTQRLTINLETCRTVGVFPSFSEMTSSDIINEEEPTNRNISITQAIETAMAVNLSKLIKDQEIKASAYAINKARTSLNPQIDGFVRQVEIDKDRAKSMLTPAEQSTQLGASLKYLIMNEDAKANIDIQKYFLAAKKDEERGLMLDIIQNTAISYLNVLKAKTLKNIQEDNLEVTKANLEIAKQHEKIGTASPAEVYRWEIQMASARQAVVEASALKKKSEIALNELLSARQDEPFNTQEKDIFTEIFFFDYNRVAPYIDNLKSFKCFSQFMVDDSFVFSPELNAINQHIDATSRLKRAHKRRLQRHPTLALTGNITRTIDKHGEGKNKPTLSDVNLPFGTLHPGLAQDVTLPLSSLFKFPDDNDWSVALSVTFPIFDGELSRNQLKESESIINLLKLKRDDLMQKLELRTRLALEDTRSSFITIKLAKQRVEYAEKALEVVRSAYAQGLINILDLIDAQNAYRIAKEANANAVFTFLSDFIRVCRSVGTFDFILNQRTNNEYYERIEHYFKSKEVEPTIRSTKRN